MSPVIALLRAANVGGRTIKAAQLRAAAEGLGHTEITTYVNSGNLVLVPHGAAASVGPDLSGALSAELGFDVPVLTRTLPQWDRIVARVPFTDEVASDPSHLVLYCWDGTPKVTSFDPTPYGNEKVAFAGDELYAYYPDGIGRSKLTLPVLEKATGRSGTARNWNTVLALQRLARERA
ncbi:DUF1697 domain-containing protein [Cellulomonas humilata]|uniref:DUF1697 domain-containing protein n=1 Tax=Cellulomonas humilata TaxID=144055 RepID=A0A7Y6DWR3_9CELL|nr:DUF1697 domain-containing protein [Cellulomonas humilata]NUU16252.1 DUF1697 domain-containing protein [Cellulomonas humilata]